MTDVAQAEGAVVVVGQRRQDLVVLLADLGRRRVAQEGHAHVDADAADAETRGAAQQLAHALLGRAAGHVEVRVQVPDVELLLHVTCRG
jgi:hypothetical protein